MHMFAFVDSSLNHGASPVHCPADNQDMLCPSYPNENQVPQRAEHLGR